MLRFWSTGVAALVAVAVVAAGATAAKAPPKTIAFSASYSGQATTKQTDNAVDIAASGTGSGPLIGAGKITGNGTGDTSQQPCVPFTGTGSMKGAAGTAVTFKVTSGSNGCGDEAGNVFAVVGHASVVSATGKLAKAKGTLKFTGTYDRTSGNFSVKFSGKLTK